MASSVLSFFFKLLLAILILSVLPITFVVINYTQTINLAENDPVPDQFPLLVVTPNKADRAEGTANFLFWPKLKEFVDIHPAHSFLVSQDSGSFSPSGPEGPLVTFTVAQLTKERQLIEVRWIGGKQKDPNYDFTGRYEAEDKRIYPRYFKPFHVGQVFQTFFISVLVWMFLALLVYVGKKLRARKTVTPDKFVR